jgi:hypothetical protein
MLALSSYAIKAPPCGSDFAAGAFRLSPEHQEIAAIQTLLRRGQPEQGLDRLLKLLDNHPGLSQRLGDQIKAIVDFGFARLKGTAVAEFLPKLAIAGFTPTQAAPRAPALTL